MDLVLSNLSNLITMKHEDDIGYRVRIFEQSMDQIVLQAGSVHSVYISLYTPDLLSSIGNSDINVPVASDDFITLSQGKVVEEKFKSIVSPFICDVSLSYRLVEPIVEMTNQSKRKSSSATHKSVDVFNETKSSNSIRLVSSKRVLNVHVP